ncbi:MAG: hypothetical protein WD065_12670 [Planctomycetaceae bacterium]
MLNRSFQFPIMICFFCFCAEQALSQDLPPNIRAALEANAESFANVRIDGYQERDFLVSTRVGLQEIGRHSEHEFTQRVHFLLKVNRSRIYESIRYPAGEYHTGTEINERSFDGEKYFSGSADPEAEREPGVAPALLTIHTRETHDARNARRARDVLVFEAWYLEAAGFAAPMRAANLGEPIESLILTRIDAGTLVSSGTANIDGNSLYEVIVRYPDPWMSDRRSNNIDDSKNQSFRPESIEIQEKIERERLKLDGKTRECRFVLDPAMNYAVREIIEWREPGRVMFHTECADFVQIDGTNLWLPESCDVISSAYEVRPAHVAEKPIYVTSIRVSELRKESFTDDDFRIAYDYPGSDIWDYTHENAREGGVLQFYVGGSPEAIDQVAREAKANRWGWKTWLLGANILLVLIIALVFLRKRLAW